MRKFNFTRPDGRSGMITDLTKAGKITALIQEGCVFDPPLPDDLISGSVATVLRRDTDQTDRDAALATVGLIDGKVPDGHIVVHPDGLAEEYFPGFYRRPNGLRVEDGVISARMEDGDGYGQRRRIIGVLPVTRRDVVKTHWTAGKTWEEIQEILHTDEAGD